MSNKTETVERARACWTCGRDAFAKVDGSMEPEEFRCINCKAVYPDFALAATQPESDVKAGAGEVDYAALPLLVPVGGRTMTLGQLIDGYLALSTPPADWVGDWVMVPREPTEAMLQAGPWIESDPNDYDNRADYLAENAKALTEVYTAMLAAAPKPSSTDPITQPPTEETTDA